MQDKTITVRRSHLKKLEQLGANFGRESPVTGQINYSGLIRDLIDKAYIELEAENYEVNCPECNQWTFDRRSYDHIPTRCPYCGSPLVYKAGVAGNES